MKKLYRMLVPSLALVFLLAATPVRAQYDDGRKCTACADCHPDTYMCLVCAERVMKAIGNCCGQGEGTAMCYANDGFDVTCNGPMGGKCECDDEGSNCESEPIYD